MSEDIRAEAGETKIEPKRIEYWNSKKNTAQKGEQVRGILLRCEAAGKYKGEQYVLKGVEGEIYLPNHTILNGMMQQVKVGRTVRVVYLGKGEASRGRNAPELYDVFMTADPIQEVPKQLEKAKEEKAPMTDYMKEILTELKFGMKFFAEGLIPDASVQETIRAACRKYHMNDPTTPQAILNGLKIAGEIFEPKSGYYKVVM